MRLRRLTVRRMPGIDEPFAVEDFGAGLSVVIGPNASGKTTLCRAIRHTLWPSADPLPVLDVASEWVTEAGGLTAEATPRATRWTDSRGEPAEPTLPEAHLARCYTLGLLDLLEERAATGRQLADRIRVQLSGGYDLAGVAASAFGARSRRAGVTEKNELAESRRRLVEIEGKLKRLADDEDALGELRSRRGAARAAAAEIELIRAALRLSAARATLRELDERIELIPRAARRLAGNEKERLDEIDGDLERARGQLPAATIRLEELRREIASCRLGESPIDEAVLGSWNDRARELSDLQRDLHGAETEIARLEAERDSAAAALGALDPRELGEPDSSQRREPDSSRRREPDSSRRSEPDSSLLDELERTIREAAGLEERRRALGERRRVLDHGAEDAAPVPPAALGALRAWLRAPGSWRGQPAAWGVLALGAAGGAAGLAAHAAGLWWGAALAGVGLGLGAALAVLTMLGPLTARERRLRRREFQSLEAARPDAWREADVARLLAQLEQRDARASVERERREDLRRVDAEIEALDAEVARLDARRRERARELGLDEDARPLRLLDAADALGRWRAIEQRLASQVEDARVTERRFQVLITSLLGFLEQHGVTDAADATTAAALLSDLDRRSTRLAAAIDKRAALSAELDDRQRAIAELEERRAKFFEDLGLEPGDADGLARLIAHSREWRKLADERRGVERDLADARLALVDRPDLADAQAPALTERLRAAEESAGKLEALAQRIGAVESNVDEARRADDLERAIAAVASGEDALAARRRDALAAEAGRFLLESVENEYEATAQPEVLRRAGQLFARFTGQRYELDVTADGDDSRFRALDRDAGRKLEVAELSDATRVQLQLAARIAFATHTERGAPLPLLLDEALTNSDESRFEAVARSLIELAVSDGRQVIYLTSDAADVARWSRVCRRHGAPAPALVDLAAARGGARAVLDEAELIPEPAEEIPPPDGRTPERYALDVGVTRLEPQAGRDAAHLFYALRDDLSLLRRMLAAGIVTAGRWRGAVRAGLVDEIAGPERAAVAGAWVDALTAFVDARRLGRGRPLSPADLAGCTAITETWRERVEAILRDVDGDARRLIGGLGPDGDERARGFRSKKLGELEEWLAEAGYVDAREPLTRDGVRDRVLTAVAPHVRAGLVSIEQVTARTDWLWGIVEPGPGREAPGVSFRPPPAPRPRPSHD